MDKLLAITRTAFQETVRRRVFYVGDGLWNRITADKAALKGLLANELYHIAHSGDHEDAGLVRARVQAPRLRQQLGPRTPFEIPKKYTHFAQNGQTNKTVTTVGEQREMVQVLWYGRKTGSLKIRSGANSGEIHFVGGLIFNALKRH